MKDKTCEIALNPKYDGYQIGLTSIFDKKTESGAIATRRVETSVNEELAQELHKPVIRKFKRRKDYARSKDNIWAADLAEMGPLSSFNRELKKLFLVLLKY